jgi:hypothetical protein
MNFITTLLSAACIALAIGTWARIVWFGFTMWGPM